MINNPIVELNHLTKSFKIKIKPAGLIGSIKSFFNTQYKNIIAVDNISFTVNSGETVALIGPNGAGKSTTIKMLTGILFPTSGTIKVCGLNPSTHRTKLAYKIGSVFGQKSQLWYHLPPIDTFHLLSRIYELDRREYKKRLDFLIDIFEMHDLLTIPVRNLSLGQRMRCEIASSFLHKPNIIFLDEPTIGLDVIAKQHVRDILKIFNEKEGVTIFLTSHDAGDIEAITKRTIIINHGKVIFDDRTDNLKKEYIKTKVVEIIFEEPLNNFNFSKGKIIHKNTHNIKVEIDTSITTIEQLLKYSLENFKVLDIIIINPALENIISNIYTHK